MRSTTEPTVDLTSLQMRVTGNGYLTAATGPDVVLSTWVATLVQWGRNAAGQLLDDDGAEVADRPVARVVLIAVPLHDPWAPPWESLDAHSAELYEFTDVAEAAQRAGFDRLVIAADVTVAGELRHQGVGSLATVLAIEQLCGAGDLVAHSAESWGLYLGDLNAHPSEGELGATPVFEAAADDERDDVEQLLEAAQQLGFEPWGRDWVLYPDGLRFRQAQHAVRNRFGPDETTMMRSRQQTRSGSPLRLPPWQAE